MTTIDLQPTVGAPSGFPFEESTVRKKLGLTKDDLRPWRKKRLVEGADFITHKKRLYWNAGAVRQAFEQFGLSAPPLPGEPGASTIPHDREAEKGDVAREPEPVTAPPGPPAIEQLLVVRADLANRRMLQACPKGDNPERPKRLLRVRVRSADNFIRGMEIPAIRVEAYGMTDLYDLARALPRKRGVW